jgi:HPt (histidine-containing phosphotransfer) domain-containing protein
MNPIGMNSLSTANPFSFNAEIDSEYIQSLYGDDFEYIHEILLTVLNDYDGLAENVDLNYSSGNIAHLKSAVHKIKPVFGFVGLVSIQKECLAFEQRCGTQVSIDELATEMEQLRNRIATGKQIIEEEAKKLEIYNRNRA